MDKSKSGFTLVELLVVIAIVSILVTIVMIAVNPIKVINDSRDTKIRSEMNQMKAALQLYYNENKQYPSSKDDLISDYIKTKFSFWNDINYSSTGQNYQAGVTLNDPDPPGDDSGTKTRCNATVGGDYFICPD